MVSRGYKDIICYGSDATISINGKTIVSTDTRGVTIATLNPTSCTLSDVSTFDPYASVSNTQALMTYVSSLHTGTFVLAITFDDPETNLSPSYSLLKQKLGVDLSSLQFRGKFAFMAQVGSPQKAVLSLLAPGGDPASLSVMS